MFFIGLTVSISAQTSYQIGASTAGLANAGLLLDNVWSVKNNPGKFGALKETSFGLQYHNRFLLKELSSQNFAFGHHTKSGNFGMHFQQTGFNLFRQLELGGTYALSIAKNMAIGININYHQTRLGDIYGVKHNVSAGVGIYYDLNENWAFGMAILNINRSQLSAFENERLPTVFNLGTKYKISPKVNWVLELEKEITSDINVKTALQINATDKFEMRLGINTDPFQSAFGFGLKLKQITIDFAALWHVQLGLSPTLGIVYQFK